MQQAEKLFANLPVNISNKKRQSTTINQSTALLSGQKSIQDASKLDLTSG